MSTSSFVPLCVSLKSLLTVVRPVRCEWSELKRTGTSHGCSSRCACSLDTVIVNVARRRGHLLTSWRAGQLRVVKVATRGSFAWLPRTRSHSVFRLYADRRAASAWPCRRRKPRQPPRPELRLQREPQLRLLAAPASAASAT